MFVEPKFVAIQQMVNVCEISFFLNKKVLDQPHQGKKIFVVSL